MAIKEKIKLTKNAAKCLNCGAVIESKHLHDLVWCDCHSIFVDGGLLYLRRGGDQDCFLDQSSYEVVEVNEE